MMEPTGAMFRYNLSTARYGINIDMISFTSCSLVAVWSARNHTNKMIERFALGLRSPVEWLPAKGVNRIVQFVFVGGNTVYDGVIIGYAVCLNACG
jgi:hypothetical protein